MTPSVQNVSICIESPPVLIKCSPDNIEILYRMNKRLAITNCSISWIDWILTSPSLFHGWRNKHNLSHFCQLFICKEVAYLCLDTFKPGAILWRWSNTFFGPTHRFQVWAHCQICQDDANCYWMRAGIATDLLWDIFVTKTVIRFRWVLTPPSRHSQFIR